jgi:hypothetical protein
MLGPWCVGAVLACAAVAAHGSTTLYKWVDADGVTHYSDHPEPGSQKVKVASAQTYKSTPTPASAGSTGGAAQPATVAYTSLRITNPEDGAVLWNTGGHVEVGAELQPELAPGHQLWFVIDGQRQAASPGGATSLAVPRGEHTLAATVTDAAGQEVITSAPIKFVVHQTSVATPPTGPTVTPHPKPH